jgi:hypothetical protein
MSKKIVEGTCRACGCTTDKACTLSVLVSHLHSEVLTPTRMWWTCQWVDDEQTRCSACFVALPTIGAKKKTYRQISSSHDSLFVMVRHPG